MHVQDRNIAATNHQHYPLILDEVQLYKAGYLNTGALKAIDNCPDRLVQLSLQNVAALQQHETLK